MGSGGEPPFGAVFFATRFHALVRSACPDPGERVPVVLLRLANGEEVDLCHIVAIDPEVLFVAAYDREGKLVEKNGMVMRFVPYRLICEVIVAAAAIDRVPVGFRLEAEAAAAPAPPTGTVGAPGGQDVAGAQDGPRIRSRAQDRGRRG